MPRGPGLLAHRIEICRVPGWIDATQRSLEESLNGMTLPQDSCRGQLPKLALYPVPEKKPAKIPPPSRKPQVRSSGRL